MKENHKRILIGLVLPILVATLACAVLWNKNCRAAIHKEESKSTEVEITDDNWQEYFNIEQEVILHKNEAGVLESVQYVDYISLKEEYRDRILRDEENFVTFTGRQTIEKKTYEITDAKAFEWKITGDLKYVENKGKKDYATCFMQEAFKADDCTLIREHESFVDKDQLALDVPGEFDVRIAAGTIYLEAE